LISAAGLLIRSFLKITSLPIGFDASQVLTAQIALPASRYESAEEQRRFFLDLIDRVGHEPGVVAATASTALPFTWYEWARQFPVIGRGDVKTVLAPFRMVTPDYCRALGVPVVRGRGLEASDTAGGPLVGLVNEQFARDHKDLGDVIGLQLDAAGLAGDPAPRPITIVGVVGDTKQRGRDVPPQGELYLPLAQTGQSMMTLAIRTAGNPMAFVPRLRAAVRDSDAELPLTDVKTLADWVGTSVAERRFYMVLLGLFAALAGLLAAGGIYGVTSYLVGLRMREIAIRLALGATAGSVRSLVIRQGMSPVLVGIAIGAGVTLFTTTLLRDQLFRIEPRDPVTLAVAAGLFLAAGLIACWLPSQRTSSADPATVLRSD